MTRLNRHRRSLRRSWLLVLLLCLSVLAQPAFAKEIRNPAPGTRGVVLPGENHLGILVHAHQSLGPWIIERTTTDQEQ